MTKEDLEGNLIPAPITTDMYQIDGGMTMPWIRWFQQFRAKAPSVVIGQIKLPGVQAVGTDLLDTPCAARLPSRVKASIYECEGACFVAPTGSAFEADITYSREGSAYTSIFRAGEHLVIPVGEFAAIPVVPLVSDFYDGDLFNVDVIAAGGACAGVELTMRGGLLLR